jgi:hypothetical protein
MNLYLISFLVLISAAFGQEAERAILARSHFTQTHANGQTDELAATLSEGQDAAMAAVQFCDKHKFGHDTAFIVQVAKNLQEQIEVRGLTDRVNSNLNLT